MRYVFRLISNWLAFFVGLYLVDTILAPYFYLRKLWMAIVLALLLAAANSTNRPFRGYKTNRARAFGFFGLTVLANYLGMQIVAIIFASFTGNPIAIMFAAIFITLLTALINNIVGWKPAEQPKVVTRDQRISDATRERLAQFDDERRSKRSKNRRKKQRGGRGSSPS